MKKKDNRNKKLIHRRFTHGYKLSSGSQIGPKAKVSLSQADEAEEARLVILQAPTKLSD